MTVRFDTWDTARIEQHLKICLQVLRTDPLHTAAKEQARGCEEELQRRRKPKEPDICDIIMQESA